MALSLDRAVSSLLCVEESESIYFDDDDDFEKFEATFENKSGKNESFEIKQGFVNGLLPLQSDEVLDMMFKKECEHLPASDYMERYRNGDLDLVARQEAVDWIKKVHSHFNFGPVCAYLAVNYLDRFISAYELSAAKTWMMQLLAVACLSIAAKMEETEVPSCLGLQVAGSELVFEARTIQRMELLVLSTLKWRMQSITPFSFIDYFLAKTMGDHIASTLPVSRSSQLILSLINGIDFLEFRPSEIAAAAALSVAGEIEKPVYEPEFNHHLQKDRLIKCVELMKNVSSSSSATSRNGQNGLTSSFVPQSPNGVLDVGCLSYRSDDSTPGSCSNSSNYSENTKRRKLN